ncbi:MAG: voltage-gated potassium channel [Candidatus Latescibacterota bacterium]|jgi:voltage-gated potassium channel
MRHITEKPTHDTWRHRLHVIIFEADTPAGKAFDVGLIVGIALSIIIVMLDSMQEVSRAHGDWIHTFEWGFTLLFTVEYALRLMSVGRPWRYALSFYGIVDLLSIIPTYLSLFLPGTQYFLIIRTLRVLRIFRIFKLAQYVSEARMLTQALHSSRRKITIFLFTVLNIVIIAGATMYLVEGGENGFTSIPHSIYWAIVTITTVGYGDISPQTDMGKTLAAILMIVGYSILAVPTGIITAELSASVRSKRVTTQCCPECSGEGHDHDAKHCKYCGSEL